MAVFATESRQFEPFLAKVINGPRSLPVVSLRISISESGSVGESESVFRTRVEPGSGVLCGSDEDLGSFGNLINRVFLSVSNNERIERGEVKKG